MTRPAQAAAPGARAAGSRGDGLRCDPPRPPATGPRPIPGGSNDRLETGPAGRFAERPTTADSTPPVPKFTRRSSVTDPPAPPPGFSPCVESLPILWT